jgi:hypothetical protein
MWMHGPKRKCEKKVKWQKNLKYDCEFCVKIWNDMCYWLGFAQGYMIDNYCWMQRWNNEWEKKVKKQKYLKYIYMCCVKF